MKNKIVQFFLVLLFAVVLEVLYFNFDAISDYLDNSIQHDISYQLSDMELTNFNENLISSSDPMLCIYGIDIFVRDIIVRVETNGAATGSLFYTTQSEEDFSAEKMLLLNNLSGTEKYLLNSNIHALRVDPGEDANIKLYDFEIILNPSSRFDISVSRIITILIVYYGFTMLFSIQRMPEYKTEKESEDERK